VRVFVDYHKGPIFDSTQGQAQATIGLVWGTCA